MERRKEREREGERKGEHDEYIEDKNANKEQKERTHGQQCGDCKGKEGVEVEEDKEGKNGDGKN